MNRKILAAIVFAAVTAASGHAKDEVIMTVNGNDVSRSEFEYLYHKNKQQQVDPQTLEEYAEMFKIYKLKVADALDQRLDTLPSFIKEMKQYRSDLAAPYLTDSAYIKTLVQEAFDRSREEVESFHIMLSKGRTPADNKKAHATADSIRQALLGGANFAELAEKYSVDRGSSTSGGRMGFIQAGRFPYFFETTAYSLQPGEISEIVESPQGYHILKGGQHRQARGTVLTEHIMKMVPQNSTPEAEAQAKSSIDSIYNAVKANPEKFEDLARELSDDKGSGRNGGKLNWFGAGMMVEPFDSAAFAIAKGEISTPFRSRFGWHIVRKLDARGPESFETMKPGLTELVTNENDERSSLIHKNMIAKLSKKFKGQLNEKNVGQLRNDVLSAGIDSTWVAKAKDANGYGAIEIAKTGKKKLILADWAKNLNPVTISDGEIAAEQLDKWLNAYLGNRLIDEEYEWLEKNETDYANLLKEYYEGSLLYEASVRRVWDKAAKDTEGLNEYFEQHRSDYTWKAPHAKGLLVQAANDSVADLVKERLKEMKDDKELKDIRKQFIGKASIDHVLMEQGHNGMVDNIMFGGDPVKPSNKRYTVYFMWNPRLLNAPEVMTDVKGLVTGDYQNQLESDWVEELKAKYPVIVNEKVLGKVK